MAKLRDSKEAVRQRAVSLVKKLVNVRTSLAPRMVEVARSMVEAEEWYVKQLSLALAAWLVEANAELVPELLHIALTGIADPKEAVRKSALALMEKLV